MITFTCDLYPSLRILNKTASANSTFFLLIFFCKVIDWSMDYSKVISDGERGFEHHTTFEVMIVLLSINIMLFDFIYY